MSSPVAAPPRPASTFTTLVAVGVIVVAAGLILPRLLSLSPNPPTADAAAAAGTPPPPPAPAAPTAAPDPAAAPEPSSLTWVMAKLIFGLATVAAVCIGVARWSNPARSATSAGVLTPLAKLAVDPRCVVHLVAAGGRRLLIGTDATGARVLLELPPR